MTRPQALTSRTRSTLMVDVAAALVRPENEAVAREGPALRLAALRWFARAHSARCRPARSARCCRAIREEFAAMLPKQFHAGPAAAASASRRRRRRRGRPSSGTDLSPHLALGAVVPGRKAGRICTLRVSIPAEAKRLVSIRVHRSAVLNRFVDEDPPLLRLRSIAAKRDTGKHLDIPGRKTTLAGKVAQRRRNH